MHKVRLGYLDPLALSLTATAPRPTHFQHGQTALPPQFKSNLAIATLGLLHDLCLIWQAKHFNKMSITASFISMTRSLSRSGLHSAGCQHRSTSRTAVFPRGDAQHMYGALTYALKIISGQYLQSQSCKCPPISSDSLPGGPRLGGDELASRGLFRGWGGPSECHAACHRLHHRPLPRLLTSEHINNSQLGLPDKEWGSIASLPKLQPKLQRCNPGTPGCSYMTRSCIGHNYKRRRVPGVDDRC